MKNESISERQGIILIIFFIIGTSFLNGSGVQAKQDAWICSNYCFFIVYYFVTYVF